MGRDRKEEAELDDAQLESLLLEAEPECEYNDFHNDQPAFLLAKVDGDELAHLLESAHATPFDTPRIEDQADEVHDEAEDEQEAEKAKHKVPKPTTKVDKALLMPGEHDNNTETNRQAMGGVVEAQRTDTKLSQAAHRNRVDAADAFLEGEWQHDEVYGTWSIAHARILYIISIFALESPFAHEDEREPWLKELHLMVLLYECIQNSLLPFSKSPQWMLAADKHGRTQKIWLNTAQEGMSFINDLCKRGFIHVLRATTEDGWGEIAYRCSPQGEVFLSNVPQKLKTQVDGIIRDHLQGLPFTVLIDGKEIYLKSSSGFERRSTVTDLGKIPYVLSPYIPPILRHDDSGMTDNSEMGYQCVLWESEVPPDRDEALVLANVRVCMLEWMLTGPNSIGLMIDALEGSVYSMRERSPVVFTNTQAGGKISTTLSKKQNEAAENKTRATLLDFEPSKDINFEAQRLLAEPPAIKRIQEFGLHINQNGVVMCGVQVEAIQDREWDDIAPNLLAGVLADLHQASSEILNPMLSKLQRDALKCLYDGNHESRTKSLFFVVDKIEPTLKAAEYMDGGRYQKEFVQLVGEIHTCRDMTDEDIIIIGKEGVLLAGPKSREMEPLVTRYISIMVVDHAIQKLYTRIRTLNNTLVACHHVILERRAQTVGRVNPRDMINHAGRELMLLWTLMKDIDTCIPDFAIPDRPSEHIRQRLWEMLNFAQFKDEILSRSRDLGRLLNRTQLEIRTLTEIADLEDRIDLEEVFYRVEKDTQMLAAPINTTLNHTGEVHMRSEVPLRVVTCCLGGFLTRDILHRLHIGMETGRIRVVDRQTLQCMILLGCLGYVSLTRCDVVQVRQLRSGSRALLQGSMIHQFSPSPLSPQYSRPAVTPPCGITLESHTRPRFSYGEQ